MIDATVWQKLGKDAVKMPRGQKRDALKNVFIDISQNPCRRPFTNAEGITGTMTTSSLYYSFERDAAVTPYEQLLWHGHSRTMRVLQSTTSAQLKSLAGEGMSLPCVGTVLWAGMLIRFLADSRSI